MQGVRFAKGCARATLSQGALVRTLRSCGTEVFSLGNDLQRVGGKRLGWCGSPLPPSPTTSYTGTIGHEESPRSRLNTSPEFHCRGAAALPPSSSHFCCQSGHNPLVPLRRNSWCLSTNGPRACRPCISNAPRRCWRAVWRCGLQDKWLDQDNTQRSLLRRRRQMRRRTSRRE